MVYILLWMNILYFTGNTVGVKSRALLYKGVYCLLLIFSLLVNVYQQHCKSVVHIYLNNFAHNKILQACNCSPYSISSSKRDAHAKFCAV